MQRVTLRDVRTSLLVVRANELAKSHRKQHSDEPRADASVTSECTTTDDSEATDVDTSESTSRASCPPIMASHMPLKLTAPPRVLADDDERGDDQSRCGGGDEVNVDPQRGSLQMRVVPNAAAPPTSPVPVVY